MADEQIANAVELAIQLETNGQIKASSHILFQLWSQNLFNTTNNRKPILHLLLLVRMQLKN